MLMIKAKNALFIKKVINKMDRILKTKKTVTKKINFEIHVT